MEKLILIYLDDLDRTITAEYYMCECGCGTYMPFVEISRNDINEAFELSLEHEYINPIMDTEEILSELFTDECHLVDVKVIDECFGCDGCE